MLSPNMVIYYRKTTAQSVESNLLDSLDIIMGTSKQIKYAKDIAKAVIRIINNKSPIKNYKNWTLKDFIDDNKYRWAKSWIEEFRDYLSQDITSVWEGNKSNKNVSYSNVSYSNVSYSKPKIVKGSIEYINSLISDVKKGCKCGVALSYKGYKITSVDRNGFGSFSLNYEKILINTDNISIGEYYNFTVFDKVINHRHFHIVTNFEKVDEETSKELRKRERLHQLDTTREGGAVRGVLITKIVESPDYADVEWDYLGEPIDAPCAFSIHDFDVRQEYNAGIKRIIDKIKESGRTLPFKAVITFEYTSDSNDYGKSWDFFSPIDIKIPNR